MPFPKEYVRPNEGREDAAACPHPQEFSSASCPPAQALEAVFGLSFWDQVKSRIVRSPLM